MQMETGVCVLHLFFATTPATDREALNSAVADARSAGCQVITAAMLGHKADIGVMAISNDTAVLYSLQTRMQRAGLEVRDSYLSITEVSEYAKGLPEEALRDRLYPQLPPEGKPAFCFYPMSKRREGHANWYATPFEERTEMMMEHGKSGEHSLAKLCNL